MSAKSLRTPTQDDILYGFAVTFDGTPQDLTAWKKRFPLWAPELEELALEIILGDREERMEE